jgi:hypothetical protein
MSNFFKDFPLAAYSFGDGESPVLFNNLSVYIDLFDQAASNISFYEKLTILDGERPDTLSYKLYETSSYHWTFFFLNHSLRESGWPLTETDLRVKTKQRYIDRVVTTEDSIANIFYPGDRVVGKSSGTNGVVVKRFPSLGQVVIRSNNNNNFHPNEQLAAGDTASEQNSAEITSIAESQMWAATLYYKDNQGEIVDIDPYNQGSVGALYPYTYMDRETDYNSDLKQIKVIKPDAIGNVVSEYKRLLKL